MLLLILCDKRSIFHKKRPIVAEGQENLYYSPYG